MNFSFSKRDLVATSALGVILALVASKAWAQAAAPTSGTPVPPVTVEGSVPESNLDVDYKVDRPALVKLTQPLVDTPQMISTIPRSLMDDRGVITLSDALRNSPGISLGAGESSWQGTNVTLRGFNARNDLYLDGMRDFGSYYRDPFDLEEVEVLEGPSSILFGRGSTGGAINQVSKTPTLDPHVAGEFIGGSDDTRRFTADLDEPLDGLAPGAAFRLNVMVNDNKVAGRDTGEFKRIGFAPSLALGLGSPTRLVLSYLHQQENDVPDYGIPWLLGKPSPVSRDSFYGFSSDYLDTTVDVATLKVEHDFGGGLTLREQFRGANYDRNWRDTEPQPTGTITAATPLSAIIVNRNEQSGISTETLLQSQTDLTATFNTGFLTHTLVTGIEFGPESSDPTYDNSTAVPAAKLIDPNQNQTFQGTTYPRIQVKTDTFTASAYAIDTVKLTEQLELTGGVRFDHFASDYKSQSYSVPPARLDVVTSHVQDKRVDSLPSYRGSIVYKPLTNGSVYFDYSTSFNPSAEALSEIVAVRSLNTGNLFLSPEKNRVFEVGTKWAFLKDRLVLQSAVFREEKYNARVPDPLHPGFNTLGGDQQVDGADVELSGDLTAHWQIHTGYTYLDSKVIRSAPGGAAVGMALFNAPKNNFTLWTTYALPWRIEVGGGATYLSSRLGQNTAPVEVAPGYTTFDAMTKWRINDHLKLQLNLYNLTDKYYYDQIHGFHIIPGAGRSALVSLAYSL